MFPVTKPLQNTYHLMRAGTSLLELDDIWSTNPLFLTNREDALAVEGEEQVVDAAEQVRGQLPTIIIHSLAASCIDTSNILGRELKLGRDRIVPEFTYLDPRGIGGWDMRSRSATQPAVWAMDEDEAGPYGKGGRPPPNDDSTPHETLADQAVRLRQCLSLWETQYSGDTILLVFPDGTGPALLSAMMAGIPYNHVHQLEFAPGEVRLDVTPESTRALYQARQADIADYLAMIEQGREQLPKLRAAKNVQSLKDQKMEAEQRAIESAYREKERLRLEREEREDRARLERLQQAEELRQASGTVSPTVVGAAGLMAVTGSVISLMTDERMQKDKTTKKVPATGPSQSSVLEPPPATTDPNRLYGPGPPRIVNGDKKSAFVPPTPPPPKVDPREAAKRAMQEYLDQDDGGDAWLQSLANIIEEEEEEDDDDGGGGGGIELL